MAGTLEDGQGACRRTERPELGGGRCELTGKDAGEIKCDDAKPGPGATGCHTGSDCIKKKEEGGWRTIWALFVF